MAYAASSSSAPNIPVRWRRKVYMNADHTITGFNSVDGSSGPSNPTAGHSTGPCARKDQVHAGAQAENAEAPEDGNSDAPRGQEPAPTLSSTHSHPAIIPVSAFNYEQLVGKLEFMQSRMREGWNINGERGEKENAVAPPPPRPLKRKRAAPRTTPVAPVRQSVRLKRRAQGGDKE